MLLIPGTTHIVRWTKQNLLDETAYYPLAIIRDTRSGDTLDSFALDDLGGGHFSSPWNVAQDPSGQGREVEVEITVYEDADHTAVSGMYGRWAETYLIYDLLHSGNGGGGAGSGVDYRYLGELMDRKLAPVAEAIGKALAAIRALPKPEKTDLTGVMDGLAQAQELITERVPDLTRFGKQGDEIVRAADAAARAAKDVADASADAGKTIAASVRAAGTDIAAAAGKSVEAAAARSEKLAETKLAKRVDEEFDAIVGRFKSIMENLGEALHGKLSKGVDALGEQLKKPLTVSVFPLDDEKGEPKPPAANPQKSRAERLLAFTKK